MVIDVFDDTFFLISVGTVFLASYKLCHEVYHTGTSPSCFGGYRVPHVIKDILVF